MFYKLIILFVTLFLIRICLAILDGYQIDLDNYEIHQVDDRYMKNMNGRITRFNRTAYVFNGNFTLVKAVDNTTKVRLDLFALQGNEYRLIFTFKRDDYCQSINENDLFYKDLERTSNLPPRAKCVAEPGFYWIKHYSVMSNPPSIFLTHESWKMYVIFMDSDNTVWFNTSLIMKMSSNILGK